MAVQRRRSTPTQDYSLDGVLDRLPARLLTLNPHEVWTWLADLDDWLAADRAHLPADWSAVGLPDVLDAIGFNAAEVFSRWMGTDPAPDASNEGEHPRRAR